MDRNTDNNFSLLPSANIQRSKFHRTQSVKFTFDVGEVIPFYVDEVLPGDTFQIKTSKMVRLQTPAVPFMDDLFLDTYYFFVPNRLIWDDWQKFQGENDSSSWTPSTTYQVPFILFPEPHDTICGSNTETKLDNKVIINAYDNLYFAPNSVADYMGLPTAAQTVSKMASFNNPDFPLPLPTNNAGAPLAVNALPFRAYCKICNDWFRDENLSDPLFIDTSSNSSVGLWDNNHTSQALVARYNANAEPRLKSPFRGGAPFKASKYHDYFTSALPSPQKGADVTIPIDGNNGTPYYVSLEQGGSQYYIIRDSASGALTTSTSQTNALQFGNILASGGLNITVNSLRLAFATQAQYERDARGGTRYTEIIRSNFGVISPDARLQRSEYLGGNHVPINVNQVVQQSGGAGVQGSFLGDTGAYSATTDSHGDFIQSFTEHGFVIGVCCVRYPHSYQQGIERFWLRHNRFDYYMPAFANLGEQPIYLQEIWPLNNSVWNEAGNEIFGYQEAWADYRYKPNRVAGEMRSNIPNSLDFWHLADNYDSRPFLSDSWIREDKSNVDRVLTVSSDVSNQLLADFYIDNISTRPIPMYSIPATLGDNF
jgi:hypothetical protein